MQYRHICVIRVHTQSSSVNVALIPHSQYYGLLSSETLLLVVPPPPLESPYKHLVMLFDGATIDMQEERTSWKCIACTKSSCSGLHRSQSSKRVLSAAPALLSTRDDDCPEWLLGMWTRQNNFLPWYLKEKAVLSLSCCIHIFYCVWNLDHSPRNEIYKIDWVLLGPYLQ